MNGAVGFPQRHASWIERTLAPPNSMQSRYDRVHFDLAFFSNFVAGDECQYLEVPWFESMLVTSLGFFSQLETGRDIELIFGSERPTGFSAFYSSHDGERVLFCCRFKADLCSAQVEVFSECSDVLRPLHSLDLHAGGAGLFVDFKREGCVSSPLESSPQYKFMVS